MKAKNKKTFTGEMKRLDLSWSNLARLTARILSHLPNRPLPTHSSGLLDISGPTPIENPEWEFAMLDQWLSQLQSVATFIEGYPRTTVVPLDKSEGQAIVTALAQLTFIQQSRYVPLDIQRELPIDIAAIVRTASTANALKGKGPRKRKNLLKEQKYAQLAHDQHMSGTAILDAIQQDGCVDRHDDNSIYWHDHDDQARVTARATFDNWPLTIKQQRKKRKTSQNHA